MPLFFILLLQTSFQFREWDSRKPVNTNPSLDYLAPEYILTRSCSELSDVYSFGMLCYAVYNGGKPLFENNNNMLTFKANVEQVWCVNNVLSWTHIKQGSLVTVHLHVHSNKYH